MICILVQAKLASERLEIPKDYHPFICGPYNQFIQQLTDKYDVRINVPPLSMNTDEIVVSGEKDGVEKCKQIIMDIYEDKVCSLVAFMLMLALFALLYSWVGSFK